jgi:hypothetical protein
MDPLSNGNKKLAKYLQKTRKYFFKEIRPNHVFLTNQQSPYHRVTTQTMCLLHIDRNINSVEGHGPLQREVIRERPMCVSHHSLWVPFRFIQRAIKIKKRSDVQAGYTQWVLSP